MADILAMLKNAGYERCPDEISMKCDNCKIAWVLRQGWDEGEWPYVHADHLEDEHCKCV